MDNNYQNGFYGNEPNKPFTDKSSNNAQEPTPPIPETPKPIQPAEIFQQNYESQNETVIAPPNDDEQSDLYVEGQGVLHSNKSNDGKDLTIEDLKYEQDPNPISDPPRGFVQEVIQQQKNVQYQPTPPQQAPTQPNFPNGYVQPVKFTPQRVNFDAQTNSFAPQPQPQNGQPQQGFVPQQPFQPQNPQSGFNGNTENPQPTVIPTVPYPEPTAPKKSSSKGLIVLILVLSFLLIASIVGIVMFIVRDLNSSSASQQNSNGITFTIPENGGSVESTTTATVHTESDYSDKIDSSYSGISLESKPKDADTNEDYTAENAFESASPSVVGVVCYSGEITTVEKCSSQGSGIILTSDGYVVTNSHVVGNSKTAYAIQVVTSDGKTYTAGVVGVDTRTDIAVLKMEDASGLTPATFGDSAEAELGEDILVIGNPGGLDFQNSMTKGIISAVDRTVSTKSLVKYIQTDAAINPGNSGGPLVNIYGQVIGIASSKIASTNYEGMGFAIPSATVKTIIDSLIKNGYVEGRVKVGISGYASASSSTIKGILVEGITEGGPCDNTDLKVGDVITALDGESVTSFADIYKLLESYKVGDTAKLTFIDSTTAEEKTIEIVLQEDK